MSFLNLEGKKILIVGLANKKSVAFHIAKTIKDEGAIPIFSVVDEENLTKGKKLFPNDDFFICNVEKKEDINNLANSIKEKYDKIDGLVHSIAFADYSEGFKPFHETTREQFLQALQISSFSLVELSNALKDSFAYDASVITISISTTKMTAEPYGFMAPVKASLDSTICFLAKSFSNFSNIRFNAVKAGLLKTSASAGIPGYIDYYLYAEEATLRKKALTTREVGKTAAFLLSDSSSGINAQGIVVDCGMCTNYFDKKIVKKVCE